MYQQANNMTKLCHGRKQNNAEREGQMYDCSMSESVLVIIGRGGNLFNTRGLMTFVSLRFCIRGISTRSYVVLNAIKSRLSMHPLSS